MDHVSTKRQTPTVRLRRLAAELRRLRAAAGLTQEAVCQATNVADTTLYRIETARARPQVRTLMALLDLYQVDDEQRDYLTTLCKEATVQGWLRPYASELPEEYTAYIAFEDEAHGVRNYESLFVPGLLQTEEYARAVIRGGAPSATPAEVNGLAQARKERQAVLTKDNPLVLWAIMDEAALRRMVGGPTVMKRQLENLVAARESTNITIQIIPFGAGAHPGMPGSFVLMDFADPMDTDLIYIDSMAVDIFLESDADLRRYTAIFDTLRAIALSPDESATFITHLMRDIN